MSVFISNLDHAWMIVRVQADGNDEHNEHGAAELEQV